MYAKWVMVNLGDNIECIVYVGCTPNTPEDELQRRAIALLMNRLPTPKKKSDMETYSDSLRLIDEYNYSQGHGFRFDMEQRLKELTESEETVTQ